MTDFKAPFECMPFHVHKGMNYFELRDLSSVVGVVADKLSPKGQKIHIVAYGKPELFDGRVTISPMSKGLESSSDKGKNYKRKLAPSGKPDKGEAFTVDETILGKKSERSAIAGMTSNMIKQCQDLHPYEL